MAEVQQQLQQHDHERENRGFRQRFKALWKLETGCKKDKKRCVISNPQFLLQRELQRQSARDNANAAADSDLSEDEWPQDRITANELVQKTEQEDEEEDSDDDDEVEKKSTSSLASTSYSSFQRAQPTNKEASSSSSSSSSSTSTSKGRPGVAKSFSTDFLSPQLSPSRAPRLKMRLESTHAFLEEPSSYRWPEEMPDLAEKTKPGNLYVRPLLDYFDSEVSAYSSQYQQLEQKTSQRASENYGYDVNSEGDGSLYSGLSSKPGGMDLLDSSSSCYSLAESMASPVPVALLETPEVTRDWNSELRNALSLPPDQLERYVELTRITNDFCYAALAFAKIIIAELPLPYESKTLKPLDVGGVAGGLKYSVSGILFKIARDALVSSDPPFWMYGGFDGPDDEAAIRAAHGELNGAECYGSTYLSGLNVPLISLISYRGFTIIAISLLPISRHTLLYGSADGGRTVLTEDPKLNELMAEAGKRINLLPHTVAKTSSVVTGPGDIEGHKGTDGQYYVIDFGRVMPPEAPPVDPIERQKDSRSIFYKFLRREFVSYLRKGKPLCSDAFTSWDSISEPAVAKEHAQQVREATDYLYQHIVPEHARNLVHAAELQLQEDSLLYDKTNWVSMKRVLTDFTSSYLFHAAGLNCRHIGRIICCLAREQNADLRTILLSNIVARTLKRKIEALMRETMSQMTSPSACFEAVIVNYLNSTLFSPKDEIFWKEQLPENLNRYFPRAMTTVKDLFAEIDPALTFVSVSMLLNFAVTRACKRDLCFLPNYCLDVRDIRRFTAAIRNHYAIEISSADRDLKIADQAFHPSTNARLMGYARKAFLRLKKKLPYCPVLSEKLAYAYTREGSFHASLQEWQRASNKFRKGCLHYEAAINHPLYQSIEKQQARHGISRRYYASLSLLARSLRELGESEKADRVTLLAAEIRQDFEVEDRQLLDGLLSQLGDPTQKYDPTQLRTWWESIEPKTPVACQMPELTKAIFGARPSTPAR